MTALRRVGALLAALVLTCGLAACSSDDDGSAPPTTDPSSFPLQSPSAEEVAEATGLAFPSSMTEYRSANSPTAAQLEIGFTMSAAEVESFAAASGLELVPDERVIIHSSPVWGDQNPPGDLRSGTALKGRYRSEVEIRTNWSETQPDAAAVRVLVTLR